jgi:hypothetical protein
MEWSPRPRHRRPHGGLLLHLSSVPHHPG